MLFSGAEGVGTGVGEYALAGNSRASLLWNFPFEDRVSIEFDLQMQLCLPEDPYFHIVVMAQEDPQSCYTSNFGTDIAVHDVTLTSNSTERMPSLVGEYQRSPMTWTDKRNSKRICVRYEKTSEEEGLLEVFYDGIKCQELRTDRYRSGRVGLSWNNVKFFIKNLKVQGKVGAG